MARRLRLKHGVDGMRFHDELKRNPEAWERLVIEIGAMPDGGGRTLVLGNCRVCMSTIAKEVA